MSELLNCPFCGSAAEFEYDDWNPETGEGDDGIGWAKCTNSHCGVGFHDDRDSAVEKWNKRMPNAERCARLLEDALEKIVRWVEFPKTGDYWDDGEPVSYGAAFGSNGERDYMRSVASDALKKVSASGEYL